MLSQIKYRWMNHFTQRKNRLNWAYRICGQRMHYNEYALANHLLCWVSKIFEKLLHDLHIQRMHLTYLCIAEGQRVEMNVHVHVWECVPSVCDLKLDTSIHIGCRASRFFLPWKLQRTYTVKHLTFHPHTVYIATK